MSDADIVRQALASIDPFDAPQADTPAIQAFVTEAFAALDALSARIDTLEAALEVIADSWYASPVQVARAVLAGKDAG